MPSSDPDDYSAIFFRPGFARMAADVDTTASVLTADGRPAQAALIRTAFQEYEVEMRDIAIRAAQIAQTSIQERERDSRVRPDTHGAGGPRLGDFIGQSTPSSTVPGSVLINDENELEMNVSWWWTNEEGYWGHVGREVHGFFMPGKSAPGAAASGTHPLFQATGPKGPKMTIEEPIPARWFVREGIEDARKYWRPAIERAKSKFLAKVQRINAQSSAHGPQRGGRRP